MMIEQDKIVGLARILHQASLLQESDAESLVQVAHSSNISFVEALIKSKKISAKQLAMFVSQEFGLPLVDLDAVDAEAMPLDVVDYDMMVSRQMVPLYRRGNKLFVGIVDPVQGATVSQLSFKTGLTIDAVIVEADKFAKVLVKLKQLPQQQGGSISELLQSTDLAEANPLEQPDTNAPQNNVVDDAPIVRFIHKILVDATESGASDIHFEPYEKFYRIRYRIDGNLKEIARPPLNIKEKIASRIKVVSRLDISEKRIPQDGRFKLPLNKHKSVDFRVSTLPTLFGEKIVMRILDQSAASLDIEQLGFDPSQKQLLLNAIHRHYGMVLVTGPTGSGKTVSLYSCLNMLNHPEANISTAEDPVEINLPGINQVNVNEKAGLTFSSALKAFLRQDPDVIMVGEIRDYETADIAIKAAQTGHMVFSTLHTNDAPSTLTRLLNMGIPPFNIANSVLVILAQRLARRLCSHCKTPIEIPESVLLQAGFTPEDLDGWQPYGSVGCDMCHGSGYKGRVGLFELMPITDAMTRLIMSNGNAIQIADLAKQEGMIDLRRSGLLKVKAGLTSLAEVEAVTNE